MIHPFYNAHHSPMGAFASLTLGCKGSSGGIGLELAGPANESVYVGVEDSELPGKYRALPFFTDAHCDGAQDFDVEGASSFVVGHAVERFSDDEIRRTMGPGVDEWKAGDLTFRLITPVRPIPDPSQCEPADLKRAICPAIFAELTIDNRACEHARKAFFGLTGTDRSSGLRLIDEGTLTGVGQHTSSAIATDDPGVYAGIAFQPERILQPHSSENLAFLLGTVGMLVVTVEPGELRTVRFAIGFFRDGAATTGIRTRYLYRRFFERIEDVLAFALAGLDRAKSEAEQLDRRIRERLSPERAWMLGHAIRSYVGSTQLLEREDGSPLWVVNEGEYRMMNTFDLTVDQVFFELSSNPWTVRNVLDLYAERYSYEDGVRYPGDERVWPGGIAFTHDMGVANAFSRPGYSGYEQAKLDGCFSYMSAEELMNWVLCAGLYDRYAHDIAWLVSHRSTFLACLESLLQRDNPDPVHRNGVVSLNGARCKGGGEITTYDSLDASLGSAPNNLYLAVKAWATFKLLENVLIRLDEHRAAEQAGTEARLAQQTIASSANQDGSLPAIIGTGTEARIISAVEALVYPFMVGLSVPIELRQTLRRHLESVLRPGICLFDDGGWKLSSTSRNSWLSKIYLCQFVSEQVLGREPDAKADEAHVRWLLDDGNAYYAWSDQMLAGKAVGSRYYPRGVTAILWGVDDKSLLDGAVDLLLGTKDALYNAPK